MIALPIIERELRAQARRPFTVWLRLLVGSVAGLLGLSLLLWAEGSALRVPAGQQLLRNLAWSALVFSLIEGVRQTADSLSQEKRDGTIGLLFLTDLRGLDVVLGKLAAHALNLLYALMAAFPVLGLALGAGGVTAGEFWRLQLVLLDSLFLAVACGLWASARSYTDQHALLWALGLVAVLAVLPALACVIPAVQGWPSVSPGALLFFSEDLYYQASRSRFWWSLVAVQGAAWGLLIWAGATIQRRWHELPAPLRVPRRPRAEDAGWPYRVPASLHSRHRVHGPESKLTGDPAVWLAWRRVPWRWLFWVALLLPAVAGPGMWLVWRWVGPPRAFGFVGIAYGAQVLATLVPAVLLSLAAARRMAELRQSGAIELLLCTPLSAASLTRAEWEVLWHAMRRPLAVLGLLLALPTAFVYAPAFGNPPNIAAVFLVLQLTGIAKTLLATLASVWLGLWFGLRARTPALAVGRTVIWVVLVPWVATAFFSVLRAWPVVVPRAGGAPWAYYGLSVMAGGLGVIYTASLIFWARRQLHTRFRQVASER